MKHSTLVNRLGDRPHAYLPKSIALDPNLSDGAIVLYTTLAALGDEEGGAAVPQGELADMIGVSRRSILKWTKQLESVEGVGVSRGQGTRFNVDLGHDRKELIEQASFVRVPLIKWHCNLTWSMPMRRAWIAIWSYCGNGYGCFVGIKTLAEKCGRQPRAIQRTLCYLSESGLLWIRYHRRMSSDILPFDGEHFLEPKYRSRQGVNQTADLKPRDVNQTTDQESILRSNRQQGVNQKTQDVNQTAQGVNETTPRCEPDDTQDVNQTPPYQESLTGVSNKRYNRKVNTYSSPFVAGIRRRRTQCELGDGDGEGKEEKEGEVLQPDQIEKLRRIIGQSMKNISKEDTP